MAFEIGFVLDEAGVTDGQGDVRLGRIVVGDFWESFISPTSYWSERDYESQWREGIARLIAGSAKSCLLTAASDPSNSTGVWWWPLYREGRQVFVQNHLLLFESVASVFDPMSPYEHVPERQHVGDGGRRISEWGVSLDELEAFIARIQ